MFYVSISTTACLYAIYLLKIFSTIVSFLSVLVPTPRQQSYFSHNHSFSGPCNGQILVSVFNFLSACVYTMPAPVPNGTLCHTGGLQQSVDTITSRPSSSRPATSVVPMEETREENTADKENGRSQRTFHGFQTDHGLFQARVPQFADNVNSHPVSLMATHIQIQSAEGLKERSRGQNDSPVTSQVINHRTISRRLPVAKNSTVSDDFPVREAGKGVPAAGTAASSRGNLFCGWLPI